MKNLFGLETRREWDDERFPGLSRTLLGIIGYLVAIAAIIASVYEAAKIEAVRHILILLTEGLIGLIFMVTVIVATVIALVVYVLVPLYYKRNTPPDEGGGL